MRIEKNKNKTNKKREFGNKDLQEEEEEEETIFFFFWLRREEKRRKEEIGKT